MQRSAFCRSRRELFQIDPNSNAYLLAKFGFDTAENEPFKIWLNLPNCHPRSERSERFRGGRLRGAVRGVRRRGRRAAAAGRFGQTARRAR